MRIKITRKMLNEYRNLKRQIPVLEYELKEMWSTDKGMGNSTVFDYQTGYPRPQSVVGFDQEKYNRRKEALSKKKEKVRKVEKWIDAIEDGQVRCVFRMFYINNMTWEKIAVKIGYAGNPDYPRLHIRDAYLKKIKIKKKRSERSEKSLYNILEAKGISADGLNYPA